MRGQDAAFGISGSLLIETSVGSHPCCFFCFDAVSLFLLSWFVSWVFRFAWCGVAFVGSSLVELTFFSSVGWESWDVEARQAIPERMPVLVDDDLRFDDDSPGPRPSVAVNRWLRELPSSGAPSPGTWAVYARVLRNWMVFCAEHGTDVFAGREDLKAVLGAYAAYRAEGPERARFAAATWNRHVSILSCFYQWAVAEGHAAGVPFSYAQAQVRYGDVRRDAQVNLARRRVPKRHVTIRYLEADFAGLFIAALGGLGPDGMPDTGYRGRELARNAAVGKLALASGLRRQEFSYLLVYEVPPLPLAGAAAGAVPGAGRRDQGPQVPHDVGRPCLAGGGAPVRGAGPGRRGRRVAVAAAAAVGRAADGGRAGRRRRARQRPRVRWDMLGPGQRRRLVAPGGGSCLLAVRSDGGPFTAWESVFTRASDRIRRRFEPRFPHVHPHRLRHTFALAVAKAAPTPPRSRPSSATPPWTPAPGTSVPASPRPPPSSSASLTSRHAALPCGRGHVRRTPPSRHARPEVAQA